MKNRIPLFALLLLTCLLWNCTGIRPATVAGPEGYACFTSLNATRAEITRALWLYYEKYPENRIDYKYLKETGMMNQTSMNWAKGNPARTDTLERGYFYSWHLKTGNTRGERWQLKTSDGKFGYGLTTEYCDTAGQDFCNLCLVGQIPSAFWYGTRKGDPELSKKEMRQFVAYLEQDLVAKLRKIIEEERRQKQ